MNTLRFFSTSLIALLLIIIFNVSNSFATSFEKKYEFCKLTSLWLPVMFENAGVNGTELCKVSGGRYCSFGVSIGTGICQASGSSYCSGGMSIGEGICRAGGSRYCSIGMSIREGICKAIGICNFGGGSAIEVINAVVKVCGTKVLHFGFSR